MKSCFKMLLAAAALAMVATAADAGGFFTNGVPRAGGTQYPSTVPLTGSETVPADTNLSSGQMPQSEAITLTQLQAFVLGYASTATATSGAATCNYARCVVTSESLTTASAAFYTLTLTNSKVTANSIVLVSVGNGTNTTVAPAVASVTPAAGSVVITIKNANASSALNGTLKVSAVVLN